MAMIVALTGEVAVLRARLDAFERLSGAAGGVSSAQVDAFQADAPAEQARAAQRQRLLRRVFRSLGEGGANRKER